MHNFCLNSLCKFAPILPKLLFPSWFFAIVMGFIKMQLFCQNSNFALFCYWLLKNKTILQGFFFKKKSDFLCKYAIFSFKIGKIRVFVRLVYTFFPHRWFLNWLIYFINKQIFHRNCQNPCFIETGSQIMGLTATNFQYSKVFIAGFCNLYHLMKSGFILVIIDNFLWFFKAKYFFLCQIFRSEQA